MWDAELHLRMYEPEKSLPYQYKALALIQEIKNSARIYVHRIGFDPPPIKEEVRLTGKIEDVTNYQKTATPEEPEEDQLLKQAIQRLQAIDYRMEPEFPVKIKDCLSLPEMNLAKRLLRNRENIWKPCSS
jgi:hypothetical protein